MKEGAGSHAGEGAGGEEDVCGGAASEKTQREDLGFQSEKQPITASTRPRPLDGRDQPEEET